MSRFHRDECGLSLEVEEMTGYLHPDVLASIPLVILSP